MITRKITRQIKVGKVAVGGGAPLSIQSMTNTPTVDCDATLAQIERLAAAGCDIVRLAVPDSQSVKALKQIRQQTTVPLVADIHFNYRLAIGAIEAGADKIRINPGNIGAEEHVRAVIDAAKQAAIPVRIGVNAGSLEKNILNKHKGPTSEALVESAVEYIRLMERFSFENIVFSIKANDVLTTVDACIKFSQQCDFPQHIGITEAGTLRAGSIKSSVGIGLLLGQGVGDTIRVSLCADPVEEVYVAKEILKTLELASGPVVIACPTCARTAIDVVSLAEKIENLVAGITVPLKIAVMGCVVNGPGEAREADVGIAGGKDSGILFVKGKEVCRIEENQFVSSLMQYIDTLIPEKMNGSP